MASSSSFEGKGCHDAITTNEGLARLKTLKKRHEELLALRNDNFPVSTWYILMV